ncbi:hypothetical protein V8B97DRAFT_469210 [Scleroderma yunnanense]
MSARSPLSIVFLLHVALEAPLAVSTFFSPLSLPFLQMTNTTLVLLKLYSAFITATCVTTLLAYSLPEFLPGKRALAIGLCIYHTVASTILYQAPRFIPLSFGPAFESYVPCVYSICDLMNGLQTQHHTRNRMGHSAWRAWLCDGLVVAGHPGVYDSSEEGSLRGTILCIENQFFPVMLWAIEAVVQYELKGDVP